MDNIFVKKSQREKLHKKWVSSGNRCLTSTRPRPSSLRLFFISSFVIDNRTSNLMPSTQWLSWFRTANDTIRTIYIYNDILTFKNIEISVRQKGERAISSRPAVGGPGKFGDGTKRTKIVRQFFVRQVVWQARHEQLSWPLAIHQQQSEFAIV